MTTDNRTMIELEVQRRVTQALSSAGVSQGVITREVLFMLPTDFVRAYVTLFNKALREGVGGPSGSIRDAGHVESVSKGKKAGVENTREWGYKGGGGGKSYRTYWTILDEDAMKVKASVDRKLRRIASGIERDMSRELSESRVIRCPGCAAQIDLGSLGKNLGFLVRFCPGCGYKLAESSR